MREKQVIGENGKPITVRVVMSGEYQLPNEGFIRKQIAINRMRQLIPDYKYLAHSQRRKERILMGIVICRHCFYPQKIENTECCFCENPIN